MKKGIFCLLFLVVAGLLAVETVQAQGTAFTYQGRLNTAGGAASGSYDLKFTVYDAVTSGNQVGGVLTNSATTVSNGLFTVTLDFGGEIFDGNPRWLEIGVRTNGIGSFTTLSPRQALLPAPYAIAAGNLVGMATNQVNSVVQGATSSLATTNYVNTITGGLATTNFVNSLGNTIPINMTNAANQFTGNGFGLTNLNATNLMGSLPQYPTMQIATNAPFANAVLISPDGTNRAWSAGTNLFDVTGAATTAISSFGSTIPINLTNANNQFAGALNGTFTGLQINSTNILTMDASSITNSPTIQFAASSIPESYFRSVMPTPFLAWGSFGQYGNGVTLTAISNFLITLDVSPVKFLGRKFIVELDDGWEATNGTIWDSNGILQCNTNAFPGGIAAVSALVHQHGYSFGLFLQGGFTSDCGPPWHGVLSNFYGNTMYYITNANVNYFRGHGNWDSTPQNSFDQEIQMSLACEQSGSNVFFIPQSPVGQNNSPWIYYFAPYNAKFFAGYNTRSGSGIPDFNTDLNNYRVYMLYALANFRNFVSPGHCWEDLGAFFLPSAVGDVPWRWSKVADSGGAMFSAGGGSGNIHPENPLYQSVCYPIDVWMRVQQDPLFSLPTLVYQTGTANTNEVWLKPMQNNTYALWVVNWDTNNTATVSFTPSQVGLSTSGIAGWTVHDCWSSNPDFYWSATATLTNNLNSGDCNLCVLTPSSADVNNAITPTGGTLTNNGNLLVTGSVNFGNGSLTMSPFVQQNPNTIILSGFPGSISLASTAFTNANPGNTNGPFIGNNGGVPISLVDGAYGYGVSNPPSHFFITNNTGAYWVDLTGTHPVQWMNNGTNITGAMNFALVTNLAVNITNAGNVFTGIFTNGAYYGNGGGLTNLNAANLVGSLPQYPTVQIATNAPFANAVLISPDGINRAWGSVSVSNVIGLGSAAFQSASSFDLAGTGAAAAQAAVAAQPLATTTNNGPLDSASFLLLQTMGQPRQLVTYAGYNGWWANGTNYSMSNLTNDLNSIDAFKFQSYAPNFQVMIDDGWTAGTNQYGLLYCNSNRWPSGMAAAAALIHSHGCRAALYFEPNVTSAAGLPQAGAFYATNIYQAVHDWGFDDIKFEEVNIGAYPQILQEYQTAWSALVNAKTNGGIALMECGASYFAQALDSIPTLASQLPRGGITLRTELDAYTGYTNYVQRAIIADNNDWIKNAGIANLGFGAFGGSTPDQNMIEASIGQSAVLSCPLGWDALGGVTLFTRTNAQIYNIDLSQGLSGVMIESNATDVITAKFMASGQTAIQILPLAANGGSVTVSLSKVGIPPNMAANVYDVWVGTSFFTSTNFTYNCPTNGGGTLLITPYQPSAGINGIAPINGTLSVAGNVSVAGGTLNASSVSLGNGAILMTNIPQANTNTIIASGFPASVGFSASTFTNANPGNTNGPYFGVGGVPPNLLTHGAYGWGLSNYITPKWIVTNNTGAWWVDTTGTNPVQWMNNGTNVSGRFNFATNITTWPSISGNAAPFTIITNPITLNTTYSNAYGLEVRCRVDYSLTSVSSGAPGIVYTNYTHPDTVILSNNYTAGVSYSSFKFDLQPADVILFTNMSSGSAAAAINYSELHYP